MCLPNVLLKKIFFYNEERFAHVIDKPDYIKTWYAVEPAQVNSISKHVILNLSFNKTHQVFWRLKFVFACKIMRTWCFDLITW